MAELLLERKYFAQDYTIGHLYYKGEKVCDTLEPPPRGLKADCTVFQIKQAKKKGPCCIPEGVYKVVVTKCPKFKRWLPLLLDVKGFEGIRIHEGNSPKDTQGCILPGYNRKVGMVVNSQKAMSKIMKILTDAYEQEGIVKIRIISE